MRKLLLNISLASIFIFFTANSAIAGVFGPRETKLIYEGNSSFINYRIDNTDDKLPWLVQAWIEDAKEQRTNLFTIVPVVFRVEPSSQFSPRVIKQGMLPEDRETVFWVVSNSLPGGASTELNNTEGAIGAKLSLAYRYKVPMIYRPASLKNIPQRPDSLQWSVNDVGKLKVYNPTPYVIHLYNVTLNNSIYKGKGFTYIIPPMTGTELKVSAKRGNKIDYGVVNDHGAVNNYEGLVGL